MTVRGGREEWESITMWLLLRCGGLCEARTPACLAAPDGRISDRRDGRSVRVSRHHRTPRGMGGTRDPEVHALDRLLLVCGDGVTGCHGWIESNRVGAEQRGLLVPAGVDPATVPVQLASGQLVHLDAAGGFYVPAGWRF